MAGTIGGLNRKGPSGPHEIPEFEDDPLGTSGNSSAKPSSPEKARNLNCATTIRKRWDVLSFAKTCSIGLRSGEHDGKNKRRAPANGAADCAAFVRAEVIHDNDVPRWTPMQAAFRGRMQTENCSTKRFAISVTFLIYRQLARISVFDGLRRRQFPHARSHLSTCKHAGGERQNDYFGQQRIVMVSAKSLSDH